MNMLEILNNEDKKVTNVQKLEKIGTIVASARKAYGNEDAKIDSPDIETVDGLTPLVHLSPKAKVDLAKRAVTSVKMAAVEAQKRNSAVNINKKIEELIATSPILVNISEVVTYNYI